MMSSTWHLWHLNFEGTTGFGTTYWKLPSQVVIKPHAECKESPELTCLKSRHVTHWQCLRHCEKYNVTKKALNCSATEIMLLKFWSPQLLLWSTDVWTGKCDWVLFFLMCCSYLIPNEHMIFNNYISHFHHNIYVLFSIRYCVSVFSHFITIYFQLQEQFVHTCDVSFFSF